MNKFLKLKTGRMAIVWALVLALFTSSITSCDKYDDSGIITEIEKVAKSVSDLKGQVDAMAYIKSITLGADGKLTITPSTGSAVLYDAKSYVAYDVKLVGNKVMVKGPNDADYVEKGAVDPSLFKFVIDANGKLTIDGKVTEVDLASWMAGALSVDKDNYLLIGGQKSDVKIPKDDVSKLIASLAIEGNNIKVTYQDGTSSVVSNIVTTATDENGFLTINGVATTVKVQPILTITKGELKINGISSDPAVKVLDANAMIMNKDENGNVLSVTLTDADGNTIRIAASPATEPLSSMLFIPSLIDGGVNAIEVGYINSISPDPIKAMFNWQMVNFRMNPTASDLSSTSWAFINTEVKTRASNDSKSLFKVPAEVKPYGFGAYSFKLEVNNWLEPTAPNNTHLLALEASGKDVFSGKPTNVVSDYVKVIPVAYGAHVSNKIASETTLPAYVHYLGANTQEGYALLDVNFNLNYTNAEKLNVNDLVLATAHSSLNTPLDKPFEDFNFLDYNFKFTNIPYVGEDKVTDQSKFIKIEEDGTLTVLQGTAAISRKPIVKVDILSATGLIVASGCIKFEITEVTKRPDFYTVPTIDGGERAYESLFTGDALGSTVDREYETNVTGATDIYMNWVEMNKIYTALKLSHDKFNENYGVGSTASAKVSYNGTVVNTYTSSEKLLTPAGEIIRSNKDVNMDTYAMYFAANPYSKFGKNTITLELTPKSINYPVVVFTFEYTVKVPVLNKEILIGYQYDKRPDATAVRGMKMSDPAKPYEMVGYLGSSFEQGSDVYRKAFESTPLTPAENKIGGALHSFVLNKDYTVGEGIVFNSTEKCDLKNEGVEDIDIDVILGTKGNPKTGALIGKQKKLVTAESIYNMNFVTKYINGEVDNFIFDVVFTNPLTIVYATDANFTMVDELNPTQLNVAPNYNVMFDGKLMFKGQDAQDGTNGTVKASDYLPQPFAGFTYTLDPSKTYITLSTVNPTNVGGNVSKDGIVQWKNGDMKLTTTVVGGTIVYKFVADFAEVTLNADTIYIEPRN